MAVTLKKGSRREFSLFLGMGFVLIFVIWLQWIPLSAAQAVNTTQQQVNASSPESRAAAGGSPPKLPLLPDMELYKYRSLERFNIQITGIDPERLLVHNDSFPVDDGMSCTTGQEAYTPEEAKIVFKFEMDSLELTKEHTKYHEWLVLDPEDFNQSAKRFNTNCINGICNFYLAKMSFVCGPVPPLQFKNGMLCADGSEPHKREKRKGFYKNPRPITRKMEKDMNLYYNIKYGNNCVSKTCFYHYERGGGICGSTSAQPIKLLLLVLFCFASERHL